MQDVVLGVHGHDAQDRIADLEWRTVARGDESGHARVDDRSGTELAGRLGRDAGQSCAVRLDDGGPDLGSTQVERKDRS